MNLIEIFKRKERWHEVCEFLASGHFCIARNPDAILDEEVRCYPNKIALPVGFRSSEYSYSRDDLVAGLEENLRKKIPSWERDYRKIQHPTWKVLLENRDKDLPDNGEKYSDLDRGVFLQKGVLAYVDAFHRNFLRKQLRKGEIDIRCFKSVYIMVVAIFCEYYVQRKPGKASDVADFYQVGYVPYVNLAVLDNERNDLIQRINRLNWFPEQLETCNLAQFRALTAEYAQ